MIARAHALAQKAGYNHIHYAVQDANQRELPAGHYDAIWLEMLFKIEDTLITCGELDSDFAYIVDTACSFPAEGQGVQESV